MDVLTHEIRQVITEHRAWAGPILGVLAFGESMVAIGALLPATALLVVAGGLIATGALDAGPIIVWATIGSILGDSLSYLIGRRWGPALLSLGLLKRYGPAVDRVRSLLNRQGAAVIFVGRFSGPLRALVPVLAGLSQMPPHRFYPANVVSGLVWVIVLLAPGYLAARGNHHAPLREALWIGLAVTVTLAAAALLHRALKAAQPGAGESGCAAKPVE